MPVRLRRRLTIAFVLVAGVSTAAFALVSYAMLSQARFDESLSRASADLRYQLILAQQFLPFDDDGTAALLNSFEDNGHHVVLVKENGPTPSNPSFEVEPGTSTRTMAAAGDVVYERITKPRQGNLLIVGGRVPGSTAELYVVHSEDGVYDGLAQVRTALFAAWVGVLLVSALIAQLPARRMLDPVGRAARAARSVAEGLLATRLPVKGRDEFGAWAESFNLMAEALEVKMNRERRFTADVAHELRTPVTALVAAASLLREHLAVLPPEAHRPAELLVADVVRLRHLVEELMEISRLDSGQEDVIIQPVELVAHVEAIVADRGWRDAVEVSGAEARVWTDPRRLERVLANLIANAIEHGGPGARVAVDHTVVTVADNGPGMAPEHLPRIFERFFKADPARSAPGSGLGLAIARENARLLGADLRVRSEPGAGTQFRLELPVTRPLPGGEAMARDDP
ncbi:MAG TPA: HAMP domain-containing sensor histidine kinase [Candidatus Limnocylindrales bacterium]|nr:HAMP domain-containing sensor histidine kinase [Candidatus Limnocylindrales bacterium]